MIACIICVRTFTPKDTGVKLDKQDVYTGAEYVCSAECKRLYREREEIQTKIEERRLGMRFGELHEKLNNILFLFNLDYKSNTYYVPSDNKDMYKLYENLCERVDKLRIFIQGNNIHVQD